GNEDYRLSTATRLRPRAQGCFNPGEAKIIDYQPQRGCDPERRVVSTLGKRRLSIINRNAVASQSAGLFQPWENEDHRLSTATRLRRRAQGCFNPGETKIIDYQPQRGCVPAIKIGPHRANINNQTNHS
ncbi:MAG TPA: hypothetical protein VI306_04835, partial [Pyrinomonadaceae bacterium]